MNFVKSAFLCAIFFSQCIFASNSLPDGAFALLGNWMVEGESGQGFMIDYNQRSQGPDDIFVAWFTFTNTGSPLWLVMAGDPNAELKIYQVKNLTFRQPMEQAPVDEVGTARFTIKSCRTAKLEWNVSPNLNITPFGSVNLVKLAPNLKEDGYDLCHSANVQAPAQVSGQVCFYKDDQYRGEALCMNEGDVIFNLDDKNNWDNTIASMRITGNVEVQVYTEKVFGSGMSMTLRKSVSNFDNRTVMPIEGFHRSISAMRVTRYKSVCFYDDYNYQGFEFCLSPGQAVIDLAPYGLKGTIRSMKVEEPGTIVYLGFNEDFKGQTEKLTQNVPDFSTFQGGKFNGRIQSMYVNP